MPNPILHAHIDDKDAVDALLQFLREIHGDSYEFAAGRWADETTLLAPPGKIRFRFLIETDSAAVQLRQGDWVRGGDVDAPWQALEDALAEMTADHIAELLPGDVVTASTTPVTLGGSGAFFDVITEATDYCAPRAAFLRNLSDHPGGCAAYPGAFRREAIPPQRPLPNAVDQRGVNRVNEHTLDMRIDRRPTPIRHYHGPVIGVDGLLINHSETALVLPRSVYGLPEVEQTDAGHVRIYPNPAHDPAESYIMPVRPGSIVVTPATTEQTMGHCFENCFAMLVAIPGFVAPYHMIES